VPQGPASRVGNRP